MKTTQKINGPWSYFSLEGLWIAIMCTVLTVSCCKRKKNDKSISDCVVLSDIQINAHWVALLQALLHCGLWYHRDGRGAA